MKGKHNQFIHKLLILILIDFLIVNSIVSGIWISLLPVIIVFHYHHNSSLWNQLRRKIWSHSPEKKKTIKYWVLVIIIFWNQMIEWWTLTNLAVQPNDSLSFFTYGSQAPSVLKWSIFLLSDLHIWQELQKVTTQKNYKF